MAQPGHSWQGHSYANAMGSLPDDGGVNIDLSGLDHYQSLRENQPNHVYERPQTHNPFYQSNGFAYHPQGSVSHFGGEGFTGGNTVDASYYSGGNHSNGIEPNGSGLHSHGAPELHYDQSQQYDFNGFGLGASYQDHSSHQQIMEQPVQSHSHTHTPHTHTPIAHTHTPIAHAHTPIAHAHTPHAFDAGPWQPPPIQQAQPQFQEPSGYENHPQHVYQHQTQTPSYPGMQHAPAAGAFFPATHSTSAIPQNTILQQPMNSFESRNGQALFRSQPSQNVVQQYQHEQHGGGVFRVTQQQAPHTFVTSGQPSIQPQPQGQEAAPAVNFQISPKVSQTTANTSPQVPNGRPKTEDDMPWESEPGCPFVQIQNPPKTKIGTYLESRSGPKHAEEFVAKHNTPGQRFLPDRGVRLPCEIKKDLDTLHSRLESPSLTPSEKVTIEAKIKSLNAEPVMVAIDGQSKPDLRQGKIKAPSKRKASTMASSRKAPGAPGSKDDYEENLMDSLAREISSKNRPADAIKAVEWDVIKKLWRDPKLPEPFPDAVQKNVNAFGDYVTDLWTESKDVKSNLEKAEAANDKTKSDELRTTLENLYTSIRVSIETAIKYGERFSITQLGIHTRLLGGLFVLLRNRLTSGDYNGPLPKAIMKLASLFVTVDTEFLLNKVKLDRVRQKFKNELDDEAQEYMDQIFDNGKKRTILKQQEAQENAKKGEDSKKSNLGVSKKVATTGARDTPSVSKALSGKKDVSVKKSNPEIKKLQPTDYSGLGSARKISSAAAKGQSTATTNKRPGDEDVDARAPKKAAIEGAAGGPSATKTPSTTATPTSLAATVQARARPSGSMLPGRSRMPAKPQPKKAVPPSSTTSNIGSILSQIAKPKEIPKPKSPERAPETPEETARRLRKESRRHLRVSWKADPDLTQVKVFEHDTAEDKGRDKNMLRDARDNRSEGQMLKQRVQDNDEEEVEEKQEELELRAWHDPEGVQEPVVPPEQRERNYVTRSGTRIVESEEARAMEDYESRELMAIYTSRAEIPDTPREPTHKFGDVSIKERIQVVPSTPAQWQQSLPMTTPQRAEMHRRFSEHDHFGPGRATEFALTRLNKHHQSQSYYYPALQNPQPQSYHHPSLQNPATMSSNSRTAEQNDADVLNLLQSDKVRNWQPRDPYDAAHPKTSRRHDYGDPDVQNAVDKVEDCVQEMNAQRAREYAHLQSQQPPQQQSQQSPQQPSQGSVDIAHILQQVQALQARQSVITPTVQPIVQPPAPIPVQPTQGIIPPQVQSILAALNSSQAATVPQPAPVSAPGPAPIQPDNIHSILAALGQTGQTQSPAQTTAPAPTPMPNDYSNNWASWAQSQSTSQYGAGYGGQSQAQPSQTYGAQSSYDAQPKREHHNARGGYNARGSGNGNGGSGRDQNGINRALIGTKACSFWARGMCNKGDNCTFRHDPNDLQ